MFLEELTPIVAQLAQHPISFMGGFVSGFLRLNLAEDPVKSWLDQQLGPTTSIYGTTQAYNGQINRPQQIAIE